VRFVAGSYLSTRRGIYYAFMTIAFGADLLGISVKSHSITGGEKTSSRSRACPRRSAFATIDLPATAALYTSCGRLLATIFDLWRPHAFAVWAGALGNPPKRDPRAAHLGYNVQLYKFAVVHLSAALSGFAGGPFRDAQNSPPDVMSLHYSASW
jgi:branched-chain amino acid transport system permease protein